jgi:hypothetical protein
LIKTSISIYSLTAIEGVSAYYKVYMSTYYFQTNEFGVSDNGIHLLRSGFHYKTIPWHEVNSVRIEKGNELHNWWVIFLLGTVLLAVGCYLSFQTIDILINKEYPARIVKMLMFLQIPCVGIYFVYNSLKTGTILRIKYGSNKEEKFALREIIKENRLAEFKSLLTGKLPH